MGACLIEVYAHGFGVSVARLDQSVVQDLLLTNTDVQGHGLSVVGNVSRRSLFQGTSQLFIIFQRGRVLIEARAEDIAEYAKEANRISVLRVKSCLARLRGGLVRGVRGRQVQCPHQDTKFWGEEIFFRIAVDVVSIFEDIVMVKIVNLNVMVSTKYAETLQNPDIPFVVEDHRPNQPLRSEET